MPKRFNPDEIPEEDEISEEDEEIEAEPTSAELEGLDKDELDSLPILAKNDAVELVATAGSVFQTLTRLVEEIQAGIVEAPKFDAGVNAPGTRIRKRLLYVQKVAQVLRGAISTTRANR